MPGTCLLCMPTHISIHMFMHMSMHMSRPGTNDCILTPLCCFGGRITPQRLRLPNPLNRPDPRCTIEPRTFTKTRSASTFCYRHLNPSGWPAIDGEGRRNQKVWNVVTFHRNVLEPIYRYIHVCTRMCTCVETCMACVYKDTWQASVQAVGHVAVALLKGSKGSR